MEFSSNELQATGTTFFVQKSKPEDLLAAKRLCVASITSDSESKMARCTNRVSFLPGIVVTVKCINLLSPNIAARGWTHEQFFVFPAGLLCSGCAGLSSSRCGANRLGVYDTADRGRRYRYFEWASRLYDQQSRASFTSVPGADTTAGGKYPTAQRRPAQRESRRDIVRWEPWTLTGALPICGESATADTHSYVADSVAGMLRYSSHPSIQRSKRSSKLCAGSYENRRIDGRKGLKS